jgi:molybdopterin synthase sulfur carrier subunit
MDTSRNFILFTPLEIPTIHGGDNINLTSIPLRKGGVETTYFPTGFAEPSRREESVRCTMVDIQGSRPVRRLRKLGYVVIKVKVYTIMELKKILGQREFEISIPTGSTVKDLLSWMINKWGEKLSDQLFKTGTNSLFPHIRLMVNGRSIEFLNGMHTVLQDGDGFSMLPLVAGG